MNEQDYARLEKENRELKGKVSSLEKVLVSKNLICRMIGHEFRNSLGKILGFSEILLEEYESISKEESFEFLRYIISGAKQGEINLNLLRISDLNSIKENSEYLKLGDIAYRFIESKEKAMKEGELKYIQEKKAGIIYTNKSIMNCIVGTLLGNSVSYAIPGSTIYFNTSFDPKNEFLEASFVNNTDGKKQRNAHGEGNGLGLEFVKIATEIYEGNFENFQTNGIYTARFNIPTKNLRE